MRILDWLAIFSELSEEDRSNLELFCQEKFVASWDILFREWEDANAMYILKTWSFNVSKNIDWKEVSIWRVVAEEVLWEMAIFSENTRRMWTATALEDSNLIVLLSFSIKELTKTHPELLEKIRGIIEERNIKNKMKKI